MRLRVFMSSLALFFLIPAMNVFASYVDVTGNGTPLSGGYFGAKTPARAFDNNTGTDWQSSQSGFNVSGKAWIGYDFGINKSKRITRTKLHQEDVGQYVTSVKLQYSDNGSTWVDAATLAVVPDVNPEKDNPDVGSHRYWRLLANSNTSNPADNFVWTVLELELMVNIPDVPMGLTAEPDVKKVYLTWNASSGAAGYNVYRDGVKINSSLIYGTTLTDTNLQDETTYSYQVSALDADGNESEKSQAVTATTPISPDSIPPSAPTNVQLEAGNAQVKITWDVATDNVGVIGYNVYRNGTKVNTSLINTLAYLDTGLVNGTSYSYQVTAIDAAGNESVKSSPVAITPTDQMQVKLIPNKDSIVVQITNGLAPFMIDWGFGFEEVNANYYTITGLTEATDYTVQVTDSTGIIVTQTVNTGTLKSYTPPLFPAPAGIFQMMLDNFGEAGTVAIAVILGAVALGVLCVLAIYGWRLSKRWLSTAR